MPVLIKAAAVLAWAAVSAAACLYFEKAAVIKEQIPFKISERKSDFIQKGWTIWLEEGGNGSANTVKKYSMLGNFRTGERVMYRSGVVKKPKDAVRITGNSEKKHPITVPQETFVHVYHDVEATAYDPSPESDSVKWAGITSLGWRTRYGIAAVDPRVIPLRKLIYVDGYWFAWTGDVGVAIKGKKIDLCYNTTQEAFKWGRRRARVYVLGTKPPSYYRKKAEQKQADK